MAKRSKGPWKRKTGGWWVWHEGKQVRLAESKDEAWRAWHLLQAGEPIYDGPNPFRDVCDAYVSFLKRTRSKRHAADAKARLNRFVQPWWNRSADSLRWGDVEKFLAMKEWNPTTQAGHLIALRGCLRWATKTRMLEKNPIPHIAIPRAVSKQDALTQEQVCALLVYAGPLRPLLWALASTGARPTELRLATVKQCDVDGTAVRLRESKVGRRVIYFPADCRSILAKIRAAASDENAPLFPAPTGRAWCQTSFFDFFRKAKERAGLPAWATAYSLRHSFITERLRAGMTMEDVARLAGTSANMIARTYEHLTDADVKAIADRL
jgi:site-specific recombinase XerD